VLKRKNQHIKNFLIVLVFGLVPAMVSQLFAPEPVSRSIHIRNFRYGKDPSVIRCNRGDTLYLTFSTDDTGHSFFLEEFDIDAKVSPARELVEVFKTSDPTEKPVLTSEVVLIAKHPGILNFLVAKSYYRCHVWCGPMHAFEHGKLVIAPNTLLFFSLGCLMGIFFLWLLGFKRKEPVFAHNYSAKYTDLLEKSRFLKFLVSSRWPQIVLLILTMAVLYLVVLTTFFGTKMSGRNLGVLMMWGIWLFLLVALITPVLGRFWCTICPLPFFGDLLQRGSVTKPLTGTKNEYRNKFNGLFLKWPRKLRNDWPKLLILLALTTFSATLVALPKVTGLAVIMLILVPSILSLIFENRTFCRYLCPVSGFVGPFSRMSGIALRNKSQKICDKCKKDFCEKGSDKGWACPYGLNVGDIKENTDCGLCLECTRSCLYNNVSIFSRPFASELGTRNRSEAWLIIGVFTLAVVYSVLYQGHWPIVRDYVNVLDKANWNLFAIYIGIVWTLVLLVVPGLIHALSYASVKLSRAEIATKEVFLKSAGVLLPLGLMLWISFVIPMLFVNVTFVMQSFSDPFGWGWDFFGTASIPWHQFLPRAVPWMQSVLILTGLFLSLRNLNRSYTKQELSQGQKLFLQLPMALFLLAAGLTAILFFTN